MWIESQKIENLTPKQLCTRTSYKLSQMRSCFIYPKAKEHPEFGIAFQFTQQRGDEYFRLTLVFGEHGLVCIKCIDEFNNIIYRHQATDIQKVSQKALKGTNLSWRQIKQLPQSDPFNVTTAIRLKWLNQNREKTHGNRH